MKALLTDRAWPDDGIERDILAPAGIELVEAPSGDEATLAELARDADAVTTCWAKVTRPVIEANPDLRHVARMGIGLDNIDVAACTERGIPVTNVPDYCVSEVADHAMAQLLDFARNTTFFDRAIKGGVYDLPAGRPMRRLSTQTLGIAGFGRCGRAVADRALAFGLRVIAWTKSGNDHGRKDVTMVDLDTLLRESDYLSLNVPLTDETRHLIDAAAFEKMKPTAYLSNTARGPVIDQSALLDALNAGQIAGAALDVWDPEPPAMDDPLLQHPALIATPHAAFVSEESLTELRTRVAHQIKAVLTGGTPESIVNGIAVP